MFHYRLRLTAAQYVLRLVDVAELKECADALLSEGIYTYSLGELFTYQPLSNADPNELFENALQELGLALPSREEAALLIVLHHLVQVAEGAVSAVDGLYALSRSLGFPYQPDRELLSATDCDKLGRFFYEYESLDYLREYDPSSHASQTQALDDQAQRLIGQWITKHCSVPFELVWRTPNVMEIAEAIAVHNQFDRLPILADALEDAGCTNRDILDHCRAGSEHVRGCWVVDLLLGKS